MPYTWLTKTDAVSTLQGRLSNSQFWTDTELWKYITEGLRLFNALCEQWNDSISIPNATGAWINTGTLAGSPRLRTVTNESLYSQMAYMLLESVTNGVWTGSSQFNLSEFQSALQRRVQEVIQATSCNITLLPNVNATPGVRDGYTLPDTALEVRRMRFLALEAQTTATASSGSSSAILASAQGVSVGQVISGTGIQPGTFVISLSGSTVGLSTPTTASLSAVQFYRPYTLTKEDKLSFQSFEPGYMQTVGYPQSWAVASEHPLTFDVDIAPTVPGYFEVLALVSSGDFSPPSSTLLGIPDDWSMVPMYGALADVLSIEQESTARKRSEYCLERYKQLLEAMKQSNWLLHAYINQTVASVESLAYTDSYAVDWQESQGYLPSVVEAGMDMIAPIPQTGQLLTLQVVSNAPLLDSTGTYVQVSRDDWNAILNYAHHLATFKLGDADLAGSMPMLNEFYRVVVDRNQRWARMGMFVSELKSQGKKQSEDEPKWKVSETQ